MKKRKNFFQKGIVSTYLPWLLIAIAVLVILMITIFFLREQGFSLVDRIKDLIRMR
jgi:hypothetical protein